MKVEIVKTSCNAEIATLFLPAHAEHCITVHAPGNREMNRLLQAAAKEREATLLSQFVFAGCQHYEEFRDEIEHAAWPVVWLQGDACRRGEMLSMQAVALSGIIPEPVMDGDRNMGFVYETEHARFCRLRGLRPADCGASREAQARSAFEVMQTALAQCGFAVTDTVRTWIYLDRLLEWYDEFNAVRTAFFEETGIFNAMVPASTGIGAGNPFGAAIMMDVLAVQPRDSRVSIREVVSPLQNPALDYKSSFSRAVELAFPTHRALYISGTASIAPDGKTVHQDDPGAQIELTMDVINALLRSRDMEWSDLFRGIVYFKDMAHRPLFEECCRARNIPGFPLAVSHADVCRHDLLFEIEVDAVRAT